MLVQGQYEQIGYLNPQSAKAGSSSSSNFAWRPFYLWRRVPAAFLAVFVAFIVAIEALVGVSARDQGITTSETRLYYLWRFGPVAILSLAVALWSRVEFQAKMVTPWLRLLQGQPVPAERSILLDYLHMWSPKAAMVACRDRDWLVASATVVTLLLTAATVVSTSLFTLMPVPRRQQAPVEIRSRFTEDPAPLLDQGVIPYFTMFGLLNGTMPHPAGASEQYAYQRFASNLPPTAELTATVDAISVDFECEPAELVSFANRPGLSEDFNDPNGQRRMNISIAASGCQLDVRFGGVMEIPSPLDMFSRYWVGSCGNSSRPEDFRLGFALFKLANNLERPGSFSVLNRTVIQSTQVMCSTSYALKKVNAVSRGGQVESISPARGEGSSTGTGTGTLGKIRAHDILLGIQKMEFRALGHFPEICGGYLDDYCESRLRLDLDSPMLLGLLMYTSPLPPLPSLFNTTLLQHVTSRFFKQMSIIMVNDALSTPVSAGPEASIGTAMVMEERLVVQTVPAHVTAGLLAASALLAAVVLAKSIRQGILPRSPNTIIGMALLLSHSREALDQLKHTAAPGPSVWTDRLKGTEWQGGVADGLQYGCHPGSRSLLEDEGAFKLLSSYKAKEPSAAPNPSSVARPTYAAPLHPVSRTAVLTITLGIIVALEVVLQRSQQFNGIADVAHDAPVNYLWTVVPALVFVLIAMYHVGVDFLLRSLQPYHKLRSKSKPAATFHSSVNLNLLDRCTPAIVFLALKTRSLGPLTTTAARLVASLLTIFSASLLSPQSTPLSSGGQLRPLDAFRPFLPSRHNVSDWPPIAASLILQRNLSYPASTFGDLVFPRFATREPLPADQAGAAVSPLLRVTATVPALRSRLACRVYTSARDVEARWLEAGEEWEGSGGGTAIWASVRGDAAASSSSSAGGAAACRGIVSDYRNVTDFAFGRGGPTKEAGAWLSPCRSQYVYVWGRAASAAASPRVPYVAAMGCNETIEAVDVRVTMLGSELRFDPAHPPFALEDTARVLPGFRPNNTLRSGGGWGYQDLYSSLLYHPEGYTDSRFDQLFSMVSTSRRGVDRSTIADPGAAERVAEAVRGHHRLIRAQTLNVDYRVPSSTTAEGAITPVLKGSSSSAAAAADGSGSGSATVSFGATATDPEGRRRLMQDAVSTRVLEALLAATALLSLLAWALMRDTRALPCRPTSVAGMMSLLADSNVFEFLDAALAAGKCVQGMGDEELERLFDGGGFWLGWVDGEEGSGGERDCSRNHGAEAGDRPVYGVSVIAGDAR